MDNTEMKKTTDKEKLDGMFSVGAHLGYQRGRRHPSVRPYLFGSKNRVDIIDLEKSSALLDKAKAFVKSWGQRVKLSFCRYQAGISFYCEENGAVY